LNKWCEKFLQHKLNLTCKKVNFYFFSSKTPYEKLKLFPLIYKSFWMLCQCVEILDDMDHPASHYWFPVHTCIYLFNFLLFLEATFVSFHLCQYIYLQQRVKGLCDWFVLTISMGKETFIIINLFLKLHVSTWFMYDKYFPRYFWKL